MIPEEVARHTRPRTWRGRARSALGGILASCAAVALLVVQQPVQTRYAVAEPITVPAPIVDEPVPVGHQTRTAVLAGGCFWGVQGVFQHVNGVSAAESGYAGGDRSTANYPAVSDGGTGHAESVRISYDPAVVTFGELLHVFFSVVVDPTQVDRQGPDIGTQYRSAIFAQDDTQRRVAASYIAQLDAAAVFTGPIVTTVSPKAEFFPAERYHQDFLDSNPTYAYIAINDIPKVGALKLLFPTLYRDEPVLMFGDSAH